MAELTIRLRKDPETGKHDIIIDLKSDEDALPHEHEQMHREAVEKLAAARGTQRAVADGRRVDGAGSDAVAGDGVPLELRRGDSVRLQLGAAHAVGARGPGRGGGAVISQRRTAFTAGIPGDPR